MNQPHVTPLKRWQGRLDWDAVVIGSGLGSLTTAALLAKHGGKRVLVLEQHYMPGGYTHVFHRPGYEWDVGVHYVGDLGPGSVLRAVFDEVCEGRLAWASMGEVYDRIVIGDDEYPLPAGRENLRTMLKERFPGEEAAIDGYFSAVKAALRTSLPFHAEKAMPAWLARIIGPRMRRPFLKHAGRTTREVLAELTADEKLMAVLTGQYGDYGLPPSESSFMIHAMVANHYFEGGWYPVGGSGKIAESIIPTIAAAGGEVLINAAAAEVVVEKGRATGVRLADGRVVTAPVIVSGAGILNTFGKLVPEPWRRRLDLNDRLREVSPSYAHVCLYVGIDAPTAELGLTPANLWIYPDEQHDRNVARWLADPEAPIPVTYISFPSAKDPDFAARHPGKTTIDIITVANPAWFDEWRGTRWKKRPAEYEAFKKKLADRLLEELFRFAPQLRGRIDVAELSTPLTTAHFCAYDQGEIYGLSHDPSRFRRDFLRARTPVKGLYLTGQDIVTAGVAGALFAGGLTASAVLGKNLIAGVVAKARGGR